VASEMRTRRCPVCRTKFEPARQGQKCCPDPDCAVTLGRQIKEKADRIADRKKRLEQKTMSQLRHEAQFWFNRFIRLRDAGLPCVSCGKYHTGQIHASHYMSVGAHPELRYEERNVHSACSICNNHLSGNLIEYRKRLIVRCGIELVEWLEGQHEPKHYDRGALVEIKDAYRAKCREIEKCNAA
jgi:hypothetical protein